MLITVLLGLQKLIIGGSAVYHLVMGGLCLLSVERLRSLSRFLYAVQVPESVDPRFEYGLRPLGAFALVLSLFCFRGVLLEDPGYRSFVAATLAFLFTLRAGFRWFHRDLFERAFGVVPSRSLKNIVFNLALSGVLLASVLP
jgi:hypothetical protein